MRTAYFDCFSGISGDMALGALVHLGVPAAWLQETLRSLPLDGFDIQARCIQRNGIAAMKVDVETAEDHHHRQYGHVQALIEKSPLSDRVKRNSLAIFERIAEAEAKIHGCPKESVHFHEVGSMDAIVDVTVTYLDGQAKAGAEAVQLFDSWAGSLAPREFERWVIAPNAAIVSAFSALHPHIPVIGFPKGVGEKLPAYARETGVQAIGVDETVDPSWAARELPPGLPVQGNLDPLLLLAGGPALEVRAREVLEAFAGRPHVFNLGHGIDKETPIAHVERLLAIVRDWRG